MQKIKKEGTKIMVFLSAILLAVGCILKSGPISTSGSIIYAASILISTIELIFYCMKVKKGAVQKEASKSQSSSLKQIIQITQSLIFLYGMIAFIIALDSKKHLWIEYTGMIIWPSIIIGYMILPGIIIESIVGVPMKFRFGEWQVYYPKKRYKS